MRNWEIGLYGLVAGAVVALGVAVGFALGIKSGLLCLALGLLLAGWGLAFTLWRYRKIKALCRTLQAAATGAQVPDIRTNREGELSILQNDLYKLLTQLAGQADHLRTDKRYLADTLSDISHQLNTPLTSLMVHVDLLQSEVLPPETRRWTSAWGMPPMYPTRRRWIWPRKSVLCLEWNSRCSSSPSIA